MATKRVTYTRKKDSNYVSVKTQGLATIKKVHISSVPDRIRRKLN